MNVNMQATPTATVSHAAFVACEAARDARRSGADSAQQAHAYDIAYGEAMGGAHG